jgi:hypothetical protein
MNSIDSHPELIDPEEARRRLALWPIGVSRAAIELLDLRLDDQEALRPAALTDVVRCWRAPRPSARATALAGMAAAGAPSAWPRSGAGRPAAARISWPRPWCPTRRRGHAPDHRQPRRGGLRAGGAPDGGRFPRLAARRRRPTPRTLAALAPGLTPEMVAAVSKLMRNQDLMLVAREVPGGHALSQHHRPAGPAGSVRLQPNHPTDDPPASPPAMLDGLLYGAATR